MVGRCGLSSEQAKALGRKTIELGPGVSLEGISERDILVIREKTEKSTRKIPELVLATGPLYIKTIRRQTMDEMGVGEINIMTRMRKNYNQETGYFSGNGSSLERIDEGQYDVHDKMLKGAGL